MLLILKDRKFLRATALLVGTMVGVGIFGIPFAFAKAGFWMGTVWLVVLTALTAVYNLMFAELTLRTQGVHHVAGYANIYLGPWARRATFFALVLSGYGTLLAYMIIVGGFLHNVLSYYIAVNPDLYSLVFAGVWSLLVFARLRTVASVDLFMMCAFGAVILLVFLFGIPNIQLVNLQGVIWDFWFLPYGIIMFALAGANTIPLQRQLLAGREKLLRPAILTAVALVSILYLVFAFTVVGISGDITTPDALAGLFGVLGPAIIILGSLFGIMTISTSFLMMSEALYETFHVDYKVRPLWAWALVIGPPMFFFWSGLRNFIDVIGLVGSVAVGILSVVILLAYLRGRAYRLRDPEFTVPIPRWVVWGMIVVFAVGIIYAAVI